MQIILLEQVKNLGNIGEVVKVKDGYARNFLLPNNKALRATKSNIDFFEVQKAEIKKQNDAKIKEAEATAKKVDGILVDIIQQAGEDGRLYGSVTIADIAEAVSQKSGQQIERKQVVLHDPIKYIGIHEVDVDLHAEVNVKVDVNVARTSAEAKISAEKFKKGERVMEGPSSETKAEEQAAEAAPAAEAKEEKPEADAEAQNAKDDTASSEEAA